MHHTGGFIDTYPRGPRLGRRMAQRRQCADEMQKTTGGVAELFGRRRGGQDARTVTTVGRGGLAFQGFQDQGNDGGAGELYALLRLCFRNQVEMFNRRVGMTMQLSHLH